MRAKNIKNNEFWPAFSSLDKKCRNRIKLIENFNDIFTRAYVKLDGRPIDPVIRRLFPEYQAC